MKAMLLRRVVKLSDEPNPLSLEDEDLGAVEVVEP